MLRLAAVLLGASAWRRGRRLHRGPARCQGGRRASPPASGALFESPTDAIAAAAPSSANEASPDVTAPHQERLTPVRPASCGAAPSPPIALAGSAVSISARQGARRDPAAARRHWPGLARRGGRAAAPRRRHSSQRAAAASSSSSSSSRQGGWDISGQGCGRGCSSSTGPGRGCSGRAPPDLITRMRGRPPPAPHDLALLAAEGSA
jgi:hypothetical protein